MRPWFVCLLVPLAQAGGVPAGQPKAEAPRVERFRLDNGLTVLLRPVKGTRDVGLVVLYNIGADHDPEGRSGLAHLLEHVYITAAAGGAKARTAQEFFARYPRGANAQTGDRFTVFAGVFPKADLGKELADAAARMGDLRIAQGDLDREKPRVIEEVNNMFGGIPPLAAANHARELLRPTPLGGRKGGLPEHVKAMTVNELQDRWRAYYRPGNAILVLAGAVEPADVRKAITEHFGKLPAGQKPPPPREPGPARPGAVLEVAVRSIVPKLGAQACIAYAAPEPGSDLYAPFLVLLGRLWSQSSALKAEPGQFPVRYAPLDDPAAVLVVAPLEKGESNKEAVARLDGFVAKTVAAGLRPGEADRVRNEIGPMFGFSDFAEGFAANNPYGLAFSLGRREQTGLDPAQLERALRAVTDKDLRRAAREVFAPARRAAAIITPRK